MLNNKTGGRRRDTESVPVQAEAAASAGEAKADTSIKLAKLRERLLKVGTAELDDEGLAVAGQTRPCVCVWAGMTALKLISQFLDQ